MDRLPFREAADVLGVSTDTLKRRAKAGRLPEAVKVDGPQGEQWMLPEAELPQIAAREGWEIDLRDSEAIAIPVAAVQPSQELLDRLVGAESRAAKAEAQNTVSGEQLEQSRKSVQQARADLEATRAELDRARADSAAAGQGQAVAEATLSEVRAQAERDREAIALERASRERVEAERDAVMQSLGWLGRRRLRRG
jgi:hypothetical protein